MARRATRAGIGIAVVVTVALNAVVVAARTGGGDTPAVDPGSARSASLGAGPLEAEEAARTATTFAPTTETTTAGRSVDRPTTTAGPRGPVSTATTRLPAATSTTVSPSRGGLDGPGLYVVALTAQVSASWAPGTGCSPGRRTAPASPTTEVRN